MKQESSGDVFYDTFEHCGVGLAHVSTSGKFIRVNDALCRFLGFEKEELLNVDFQKLTPPEFLDADLQLFYEMIDGIQDSYQLEKQYYHKSGRVVWGKLTVTLVRDSHGEPDYFISLVEDIDEKKRIETRLSNSQQTIRQIVASLSERMLVWVMSPSFTQVEYINDGYQKIWGRPSRELFENPLAFIHHVHVADRKRVSRHYQRGLGQNWEIEYRIIRDDGELRFIRERGMVVQGISGEVVNLVITADDITQDKQLTGALMEANNKLEKLSKVDGLTSIYNRNEIIRIIEGEFKRLSRLNNKSTSSLLFIDLDDFKNINDTYGHSVGDDVICKLTEYISNTMRESDQFGRYGGDEFILLLTDASYRDAKAFCERLEPVTLTRDNGDVIDVDYSIGCCTYDAELTTAQQWIDRADQLMYEKKQSNIRRADSMA